MKLSMYILERWLRKEGFKVESFIREGAAELQVVRVSDNNTMSGVANISVRDEKTGLIAINNQDDSILVIDSAVEDVFNKVSAAFEYYNAWESALLRSVFVSASLQDLLDIAHLAFMRPMLIQNSQYEIVAITASYGPVNAIWEFYKKNGWGDKPVHMWFSREPFNAMPERVALKEPTILASRTNNGNFILANLFLNDIRVGHITMYEMQRPFYPGDLQLMKVFQEIINFYISARRSVLFERSILDAWLNQSLCGVTVPGENVTLKAVYKYKGWGDEEYFSVAFFSLAEDGAQEEYDWIQNEINVALHDGYTVFTPGGISVLCHLTEPEDYDSVAEILEGVRHRDIRAWGMSQPFQGLQQLRSYESIAREAARTAKERGVPSLNMRDAGLDILIRDEHCGELLGRLLHPEYVRLRRYDQENHTQLTETMFWYLYSNGNYSDTAARMETHRNTIYYRITKAFEIINPKHLESVSSRLLFQLSYFSEHPGRP